MAYISLYFFNSSPSSSLNNFHHRINGNELVKTFRRKRVRRSTTTTNRFVALSTHSNPRILKSNRKSRYGQLISPYDTDDDEEEDDKEEDEEDSDDDDLFSDDELSDMDDFDFYKKNSYSEKKTSTKQGQRLTEKRSNGRLSRIGETVLTKDPHLNVKHDKNTIVKRSFEKVNNLSNRLQKKSTIDNGSRGKLKVGTSTKGRFPQLSEELELDEKWFPLLDYLSTFGLKESHFIQIYERHMASLQINVASAQERLEFLLSVGVKHKDIRKIIMRQPQILEYTVENNLKSHVAFLVDMGVPHSRIGHIISAAPSLFSYSVEQSLKPTVRYLVEEVGIKTSDVSKVVQLSPQILVQRLDNSWSTRYGFLSKELGASKDSIVKMVRKHPQLLHYSIEDGILPRINFLRSIGMCNSEVLKVLTSLTQVLSLSLENNLKPKYLYLVNDLKNEVQSLTKYPTYLSLSLDQRIRPRHRFLVSLKIAPKGPFPLSSFVPTDESFCQQWAKTSLDKYLAFRQNLLLKEYGKQAPAKAQMYILS
ncbi:Mitochondrial transcription termination factor family protein [Thalictrum thalictroides]|uniref:Mitochondrial transcription termination factor family protein n=1 Tax=Thalictrum thalictroides TaxID=46969 RepID=A0A7J6VF54_THATH|nr:Mitochondrial transcription termination factor family protein [Thalictrum thalictroides]